MHGQSSHENRVIGHIGTRHEGGAAGIGCWAAPCTATRGFYAYPQLRPVVIIESNNATVLFDGQSNDTRIPI